jgi:hypothetical protein
MTETLVGSAVLVLLAVVAAGVFLRQFQYDPTAFIVPPPEAALPSSQLSGDSEGPDLRTLIPEGLELMTPPETFDAASLSDKINGKAELYLSAGFQGLRSQRFKKTAKPDSWIELFVYDMGDGRNAFSVFSMQRRVDGRDVEVGQFAYTTGNGLFFVHGGEYVEVIATDESLGEEMLALGRNFVQQRPIEAEAVESEQVSEVALFPPEGLKAETVALHSADVFGFDRLNNTFTAEYDIEGESVTAFLSSRASPEEASELAAAYHGFLIENGGSDIDPGVDIPGARLVQIFDSFELIFTRGNVLAGVHDATSVAKATKLGPSLYEALGKVAK